VLSKLPGERGYDLKHSIQTRQPQYGSHWFGWIRQLEINASGLQRHQRTDSGGVNCGDPGKVEHDIASMMTDGGAQERRFLSAHEPATAAQDDGVGHDVRCNGQHESSKVCGGGLRTIISEQKANRHRYFRRLAAAALNFACPCLEDG
jgi:hypothetical protein